VNIVRGSALPELDCTLTNSLIDDEDNRSVDFDGAVHVCVRITPDDDTVLKSIDKFCYLGSFLSNTISMDSDIESRLAKAGCAGRLCIW